MSQDKSIDPAKPEMAWNLADYQARNQEAPSRIEYQPEACEGELMSDDEILQYIDDATRTLQILNNKSSDRFAPVLAAYMADLNFLVAIGRLSRDEYNELTHPDNFNL